MGNLEIFGQHELAELAQDKTRMAAMVGRVAGEPKAAEERPAILKELSDNRAGLARVERDQSDLEAELEEVPRLEERAKRFADSEVGNRLQESATLKSEEGVFAEARDRLGHCDTLIAEVDLAALAERLTAEIPGIAGSRREGILRPVSDALSDAAAALLTARDSIDAALTAARATTDTAAAAWNEAVKTDRESTSEVFRTLIEEGHKPDEYLATKARLDTLTKRSEHRKTLKKRHTKLLSERKELLMALAENDNAIADELRDAIKRANGATANAVVIKPVANPDRSELSQVIARHFKGQRAQVVAAIEDDGFSTRAFVDAARAGQSEIAKFGINGAQQRQLLALGEPLFRELEEISVGLAVEVQLNIAPKGKGTDLRKLEDLSKGQRATALLLLLLGASESPLVIDQPEDDLDNRFVYTGVVARLRELKGTRQIIATTHNANVPVLGDAELIVTLEGDGNNGWVAPHGTGSLDRPSVRSIAEDLLEGGREAFSARQHLYGF